MSRCINIQHISGERTKMLIMNRREVDALIELIHSHEEDDPEATTLDYEMLTEIKETLENGDDE
jgi:hypothetical protein